MKNLFATVLVAGAVIAWPASAAVVVDDDWDDGDRTDTNLPEESAWFASNAAGTPTLSAAVGSLTGNIRMFGTNTGSRLWVTHFTPPGSPVALAVGDTIKATLVFIPTNVTTSSTTTRGLRIGLFSFSEPGAARVSGDGFSTGSGGGAPGANVTGYLLNMNFAQNFTTAPLQIMKRTDTTNINLMGASAVYTALGSGGGAAGEPGFQSERWYTFEFSVTRREGFAEITTRFFDTNGWSIAFTATDSATPNLRFDSFALRPNSVNDVAESLSFRQFKVESIPYALRITSLQPEPTGRGRILTWASNAGRNYQIDGRVNLDSTTSWTPLGTVLATGPAATFTDQDAEFEPQRFYRVVELP